MLIMVINVLCKYVYEMFINFVFNCNELKILWINYYSGNFMYCDNILDSFFMNFS